MNRDAFNDSTPAEVFIALDGMAERLEDDRLARFSEVIHHAWLTMLPHVPKKDMPSEPRKLFDVELLRKYKKRTPKQSAEQIQKQKEHYEKLAEQQRRWELERKLEYGLNDRTT